MWRPKSTEVILTSINFKPSSQLFVSSTSDNSSSQGKEVNGDLSQSTSRSSLESDFVGRTDGPIVHRDIAKWVEPVGSEPPGFPTNELPSIAVIGTGDFGRALARRMVQCGYKVKFGSRNPNRNREFIESVGAQLTTTEDAIFESDIVIVAIPKDFYKDLPVDLLSGRTVVDVSNRNSVHRKLEISQAEYLQSLLPRSAVVKAFNVLSAYVLENGGLQGTKEVFFAGDVHSSKEQVGALIRDLGFAPVDRGGLRAAREIEDIPVQRFPRWKIPMIVSILVFAIFFLLAVGKFQVCWTLSWDGFWHWDRWNTLPLTTVNSALCCHALTLLALCYLPGVLAAYIQLIRGTKYSRFPKWLDGWLKMRKQLGLLMLFTASLHACMSMAVFSPKTQSVAFEPPETIAVPVVVVSGNLTNVTETTQVTIWSNAAMKWRGECFLTTGVVAFLFAVVLGITSLPSVSASLSWKEFSLVQSNLGWLCLVFACAHDLFYGWPYIDGPSCGIPSSFQYVLYVPGLTLLLKLPLLFPGISCHLDNIRAGHERHPASQSVPSPSSGPSVVAMKNPQSWLGPGSNFYRHQADGGRMINVRST